MNGHDTGPSRFPKRPHPAAFPARMLGVLAGVLMVFAYAGCATPTAVIGGVPEDFALELIVHPARGVRSEVVGSVVLPSVPAHYVVHADGTLHVARGAGAPGERFPERVRRLNAEEMLELWRRLDRLRFAESQARSQSIEKSAGAPEDGIAYIVWKRVRGRESLARFETTEMEPTNTNIIAIANLVELLDRLAWES